MISRHLYEIVKFLAQRQGNAFYSVRALLRNSSARYDFPLSPLRSGDAFDLGLAEFIEAIYEGDAIAEGFETAHLCFNLASGM